MALDTSSAPAASTAVVGAAAVVVAVLIVEPMPAKSAAAMANCSGVVHTNDMRLMGGLRRKMPVTAYTMLAGCLAIAGIGIPFLLGFSGFHSKDLIIEQALHFARTNRAHAYMWLFVIIPLAGKGPTSNNE